MINMMQPPPLPPLQTPIMTPFQAAMTVTVLAVLAFILFKTVCLPKIVAAFPIGCGCCQRGPHRRYKRQQ